jgi:phospholipid/cholesterol/gamma-HCH transport system permease protein
MPLLIVWCDIFGILGGMTMSQIALGVSFQTFLTQFPEVITLTSFLIGLAKAPVFALIVSSVGCFHGLRVSGSAVSIGEHTTKSVVLAIFLIIIADALFSVILSFIGL